MATTLATCLLAFGPGVESARPSAQTPPVALVAVRLLSGTTTYQMGEAVPLELEFRGSPGPDFYFSTQSYDRSGRLDTETFEITPREGVEDPFADLFADGSVGGGLGGRHPLDGSPFLLHLTLNDWVRFTRPGTYRLVVTSTRLRRDSLQSAPRLTAAPIVLTIAAPDEAWASAQASAALSLLETGAPADAGRAVALLRYLDTETAASALVDHYDTIANAGSSGVVSALFASRHRSHIVARMEARVDAGDPLVAGFLSTLARLHAMLEFPNTPGSARARRERRNTAQAEYDERWRAALGRRPTTAASLGAQLVRLQADAPDDLKQQIARDLEAHPAEAAAAFAVLPRDTQWALLDTTVWTYLNRPWIVLALRRLYATWTPNQGRWPAADRAVMRLFELQPAEGRQLILDEIRTGQRRLASDTLAILPDVELPELDAPLLVRYAAASGRDTSTTLRERSTTAWVMARYGSASLLPFIQALLAPPGPPCAEEGAALAYLLKHAPDLAVARLEPNQDPALRGACVDPLPALAARHWDNRTETVAIAQLDSSDVRSATDAAQVLGGHGSGAVKAPLLARLGRWSAEWKGRASELETIAPNLDAPNRLENAVVNALFANRHVELTTDDIATIRTLCITDRCRMHVDGLSQAGSK